MLTPKHTLGDFELTILSDGTYFLDGGSMFGVVPKSLWSKKAQVNERNLMDCGLNSVLVRTGEKNVLIETGIGNKLSDKLKAIYEPQELLMKSFEAAGVSPDEIDIVINSHLHFDHCGWNTTYKDGKAVPTFPNAKYYAQRGEWEHGRKQLERDKISYMSDNYDPLINSGQMQLLTGDAQILPGISVAAYPGHTRNMQGVMIESGGKTACYISDLIPTAAHIDLTWVMAYDLFPLETIESRKRYYSRAIPEQWLTIFTHDHTMPWAYLESPKPGKITVKEIPGS
ncbi:MAG: beta-lactamase-like protein [Acidobacteriaceae bacterium]|nr:beta-lactamase-like protein [Acidobacteriaceae bacterium]